MNTEEDIKQLEEIYEKLRVLAKTLDCDLRWCNEKDTVFFVPLLPPKE